MDACLLCLQVHANYHSFIPVNSPQWSQLKILSTIKKHFWPIDDLQNINGICYLCWCQLSNFHKFYGNIERAHRRCIEIFPIVKIPISNSNSKIEKIQLNPFQIIKYDLNEDPDFVINEAEDDIKIEDNPYENEESLLCATTAKKVSNEKDCIAIYTEKPKNKRGRPRKIYDTNEIIIKKPKGKRGRPRKTNLDRNENLSSSFKNGSSATFKKKVKQHAHTSKHKLDKNPALLKNVKRGRPPKINRKRGRPRKEQVKNETINSTADVNEFVTTANIKLVNDIHSSTNQVTKKVFNETKKLALKTNNLLKKRKRIQQHKALMRNYIATSVRCMNFLKVN